jgi:hypothetical protein
MRVDNQGWGWQELGEGAASEPEELRIRGFKVAKRAATKYMFGQAGQYSLPQSGSGWRRLRLPVLWARPLCCAA